MSVETISDVSEAVLTSMTEAEFANWQRQEGIRVIQHRGRYWKETVFGFWEPLHWIARLSEREATSPSHQKMNILPIFPTMSTPNGD